MTENTKEDTEQIVSKEEEEKAANQLKKEAARNAARIATKEHYARMRSAGYSKYSIFIMRNTMRDIKLIADAKDVSQYELIETILSAYVERYKIKP